MSVLAFKALAYGADKIPDRFFEKIPGGYFKTTDSNRGQSNKSKALGEIRDDESKSKDRGRRRRSDTNRNRNHSTDYSDYSDYDADYEKDRERDHRRTKSLGRNMSPDRDAGRKNRPRRSTRDRLWHEDMADIEAGRDFSPPAGEFKPYNPADYAPGVVGTGPHASFDGGASVTSAEYNPYAQSFTPPLGPNSSASARYTPVGGYAPSPLNSASYPPPSPGYPRYSPAPYIAPNSQYRTPGNAYASPPPFYRQPSYSQPMLTEYPDASGAGYYQDRPSRQDSVSSEQRHREKDGRRARARSAGQRRSRSRFTDKLSDRFRQLDLEDHDKRAAASTAGLLAGGFAGSALGGGTLSTVIGAAVGSIGARKIEERLEKKMSKSRNSQSSNHRERDGDRRRKDSRNALPDQSDFSEGYSDSDYDYHRRGSRGRKDSLRD